MRSVCHGIRRKTSLIGVLPIEAHETPSIRSGRLDKGRFSLVSHWKLTHTMFGTLGGEILI